jgi:4-aminobutyrate aminotransferase
MMNDKCLKSAYQQLFAPSLKKATDLVIDRAEGPYLYTIDGERYLDFVQGIAVNQLGHCHPALVEAACEQIRRMAHVSFNLVSYPAALEMAAELKKLLPGGIDSFFFTNTGAEAVEGALKLARYVSGRTSIIAFRGSFHGRTMGAASVTSSSVSFRKHYAPFMPQVYFAPYPYCYRCPFSQRAENCHLECLEYLRQDLNYIIPAEDVAAVLFEPIQGEGGYIVPPQRYLEGLNSLARGMGAFLIFDEIQTGMGRTGKLFASENFNVFPDIMCLGKAVGGGYPLSIIAARQDIMEGWLPGSHGTTFGGHPVACAAGLAMLRIISTPEFLTSVGLKGEIFRSQLRNLQSRFPTIGDVRGLGLMNAIEMVDEQGQPNPKLANIITERLRERKILVLTCGVKGQAIRFIPPLNIDQNLLKEFFDVLEEVLSEKH